MEQLVCADPHGIYGVNTLSPAENSAGLFCEKMVLLGRCEKEVEMWEKKWYYYSVL